MGPNAATPCGVAPRKGAGYTTRMVDNEERVEATSEQQSPRRVRTDMEPGGTEDDTGEELVEEKHRESSLSPPRSATLNRTLTVEAAELVSCTPETSPVLCETYVFDPDPSEEPLGSLYLVFEIANVATKSAEILENVAHAIRKEYYGDAQRDMLMSFESALDAANDILGDLAASGDSDWVESFHAAVCVFRSETLHISRSGRAELLLARKQHLTDIGEGISDPRTRRPLHPFTNVASGTVAEHDTLLLATPQLLHLVPRDRLQQLMSGKSPAATVALLRSLLEDSREESAFALLALRFTKAPERLPAPEVPRSLPRHATPASRKHELLRPPLRPRRPIATKSSLLASAGRILKRSALLLGHAAATKGLPAVVSSAHWSARTGTSIARGTSRSVQHAVQTWQRRGATSGTSSLASPRALATDTGTSSVSLMPRRTWVHAILETLRMVLRHGVRSLPRSAKIFLLLTVVLGILFAGSLVALSRKRQEDAAVRAALERLQEARVKKEGTDAALIYDNTDQARQLLREARAAAADVAHTPYYQEEVRELLAGIQETEDRMEKVTRLTDPKVVGDFSSVAPSLKSPAMVVIGNAIYAFNPENNAIYQLNKDNGETAVVSQTSQGIGYFRAAHALPAENMILLSTDSPGLALFDAERGDLLKQEITFPEGVKEIRALGTFGSRLYLLAPEKKMIYGYVKTLAGYEGGTPWLKDANVPADRAVAMGIDGYIYLLTDEGNIIKLLKGSPVEFKQTALSNPPKNPTRLLITEELKHLYVLDPDAKRVLVYDTLGNLSRQFVLPNAKALRDLAIQGKEEALFVLDETQVLLIPLK